MTQLLIVYGAPTEINTSVINELELSIRAAIAMPLIMGVVNMHVQMPICRNRLNPRIDVLLVGFENCIKDKDAQVKGVLDSLGETLSKFFPKIPKSCYFVSSNPDLPKGY